MGLCNKTEHCINCHEHFQKLRPSIKEIIKTKHFEKDAPGFNISLIVDCEHQYFHHLHKFEETIEGNHIFRALQDKIHIVYCIDTNHCLIFLRAFESFKEYKKFLNDKRQVLNIIKKIEKDN